MYTPRLPPGNPEDLLPYLDDEHNRIASVLNDSLIGQRDILYKPPIRLRPGLVVYADGTDWNPGSGEGLYRYNLAGVWVFIG